MDIEKLQIKTVLLRNSSELLMTNFLNFQGSPEFRRSFLTIWTGLAKHKFHDFSSTPTTINYSKTLWASEFHKKSST